MFERTAFTVKKFLLILSLTQILMVWTGVFPYAEHVPTFMVFWSVVLVLVCYFL